MELSNRDYLDLWMHQSKLFWSRLQTATAINLIIFPIWWNVKSDWILWSGVFLNFALFSVMMRDGDYMYRAKRKIQILSAKQSCLSARGRFVAIAILGTTSLLQAGLAIGSISITNQPSNSDQDTGAYTEINKIDTLVHELASLRLHNKYLESQIREMQHSILRQPSLLEGQPDQLVEQDD